MSSAEECEFHDALGELHDETISISTESKDGEEGGTTEMKSKVEKAVESLERSLEVGEEKQASPTEMIESAIDKVIEEAILNEKQDLVPEEPGCLEEKANNTSPTSIEEALDNTIEEAIFNEEVDDGTFSSSSSTSSTLFREENVVSGDGITAGIETAIDETIEKALLNEEEQMDIEESKVTSPLSKEEASFEESRAGFLAKLEGKEEEDELSEEAELADARAKFISKYNEQRNRKGPTVKEELDVRRDEFLAKHEQGGEEIGAGEGSYLSSWGGMFSALSGIGSTVKAKASSGLDKLYDVLDPNVPEESGDVDEPPIVPEEDPKSIKGLFDRLSPKGESSWLGGLDKTFDFASDTLGQALMGGIRKIESTVGVTIEPISSSSSTSEVIYDADNPDGEEIKSSTSMTVKDEEEGSSQVSRLGKNIYTAGLSTLEKLGRTTAGIVESTRGRLTPLLDPNAWPSSSTIDRSELKKPFLTLFDDYSGNEALEQIQLDATQASIAFKTKLKTLNPQKLKQVQASMKGIGSSLDTVKGETRLDWSSCEKVFVSGELVLRLQQGIDESLTKISEVSRLVEELRSRVESPLPPDNPTLVLYLGRLHLAKMTAAALYLYRSLDFDGGANEECIALVASMMHNSIESVKDITICNLLDDNRKTAVRSLLETDIDKAGGILRDATLALQPSLKLTRFAQIEGSL
jgi:hypothetical protein